MYYIKHECHPEKVILERKETRQPDIEADQVLIKVAASGVNRPDLLQQQGFYPAPEGASPILGLEVAGTIEKTGQNVTHLQIGQSVCALVPGGGYAEYCVTAARHCLPIPKHLDMCEAACLPEGLFTIWSLLWHQGKLQTGETVLLHGGNSGIASLATPILKAMGHKVIVTLRSEKFRAACQTKLQPDHILITDQDDFLTELKQIQPDGVDLILDLAGATYLQQNIYALARGGRLVLMGLMSGTKTQLNMTRILTHRLTVTGATLRPQSDQQKADFAQSIQQNLLPIITEHHLKPIIDRIFNIFDAEKAHQYLRQNSIFGKICLHHPADEQL